MQVEKAAEMGACPGVKRALTIAIKATHVKGKVYTLGPLVHNSQAIAYLAQLGVETINSLADLQDSAVIIPSHGISPQVWGEIKKYGLEIIDATCPIVRHAQRKAQELARAGLQVVIFGGAEHPEVRGLLGWAGAQSQATRNAEGIVLERQRRLGILSQTTQNQTDFAYFTGIVQHHLLSQLKELRIINTICDATRRRQEAALVLAKKVDLILVIGGPDSANTRRLAEACTSAGVATYFIESASDIKSEWLKNHSRIGITAGASTLDATIKEVIATLETYD